MKLLKKLDTIFSILLFFVVPIGLYFAFFYAPVEKIMGLIQKIFYFHVSSAWIGFFAFFITFIMSILYLITKKIIYDDIASANCNSNRSIMGTPYMGSILDMGPAANFHLNIMVYICGLYYA